MSGDPLSHVHVGAYIKVQVERDRCRDALKELVALKDGPRDRRSADELERAWQSARDALELTRSVRGPGIL